MLLATGIVHCAVAIAFYGQSYIDLFRNGVIDSVGEDPARELAFWFLICGIFLVLFGYTLQYYIKREQKPAPLALGYALLVFSVVGCLFVPVSGFWLFIPQALIIIFARRQKK